MKYILMAVFLAYPISKSCAIDSNSAPAPSKSVIEELPLNELAQPPAAKSAKTVNNMAVNMQFKTNPAGSEWEFTASDPASRIYVSGKRLNWGFKGATHEFTIIADSESETIKYYPPSFDNQHKDLLCNTPAGSCLGLDFSGEFAGHIIVGGRNSFINSFYLREKKDGSYSIKEVGDLIQLKITKEGITGPSDSFFIPKKAIAIVAAFAAVKYGLFEAK